MIPRRSSLVSCFGSGSESMSLLMIAVVCFSIRPTGSATGVASVLAWSRKHVVAVGRKGLSGGMVETHSCGNSEERNESNCFFLVVKCKTIKIITAERVFLCVTLGKDFDRFFAKNPPFRLTQVWRKEKPCHSRLLRWTEFAHGRINRLESWGGILAGGM